MIRNGIQFVRFTVLLCIAAGCPAGVFGQPETPRPPKVPTSVSPKMPPFAKPAPRIYPMDFGTTEKAIKADPNVEVKLCVVEGKVTVNGWGRNEVRVFIKNGSKININVLEKSSESGSPVWLRITNDTASQTRPGRASECLSGETIEIDVPMKASLSLSGHVTETTVDSIKKVSVKNLGGNISLRNITGGITASTYEGDVGVENSGGQISLESSSGNIVAFAVSPGAIGDVFKAKTNNGTITLQKLEHRQIDANSISGSVLFDGKFLSGGLYNFKTSNGSIRLTLPSDSSCKFIASYGFGSFRSEIPLKMLTENVSPGGKNVVANIGAGDATVNLTTNSGSIGIRKQ